MPIKNLDKIFAPRSVAVVGASNRVASVGHTVLRNLLDGERKLLGVGRLVAGMAPENYRMIRMFSHRGFEIDPSSPRDVVVAHKALPHVPAQPAASSSSK